MPSTDPPLPAADFSQRKLAVLESNGHVFRTHTVSHSPIYFGNSGQNRFDSPDGKYSVLYAGRDAFCAFVETFGRAPASRIVTTVALKARALAELKSRRTLCLADLTQPGSLKRIGADASLFAGPYAFSQKWSKAIHDHPVRADGILYPSRLDPTRHGVALFGDRGIKIVELRRTGWYEPGPQRQLLARIIEHYAMELIDNQYVAGRKPAARALQPPLEF